MSNTKERLEYLRGELRAERISWGELAELQSLRDEIDPGDLELLEAAGVSEWEATGRGEGVEEFMTEHGLKDEDEAATVRDSIAAARALEQIEDPEDTTHGG